MMIKRIQDIDKAAAAKASIFHIGLLDPSRVLVKPNGPISFSLGTFVYDGVTYSTDGNYEYHIDNGGRPSIYSNKTKMHRIQLKLYLMTHVHGETKSRSKHFNLWKLGRFLLENITDEHCGLVVLDTTKPHSIYSYMLETENDRMRILDWFQHHRQQLPECLPLKYVLKNKVFNYETYELNTRTLHIWRKDSKKPLTLRKPFGHPCIKIPINDIPTTLQYHGVLFMTMFGELYNLNQEWTEFDHMVEGSHLTRPCSRRGNNLVRYDIHGSKRTQIPLPETIPETLDEDRALGNDHQIIYDEKGPCLYIGRHRNIYDRKKRLKRFNINEKTSPYPIVQPTPYNQESGVLSIAPLEYGQSIQWKKTYLHIIVCTAWHGLPKPGQTVVCHLNADKADYSVDNLRWGTRGDNALDQHDNPETTSRKRIITWPLEEEPTAANTLEFSSLTEAAEELGCNRGNIGNVCRQLKHNKSQRPTRGRFAGKRMTFRFV